jgi:hypothetical protein
MIGNRLVALHPSNRRIELEDSFLPLAAGNVAAPEGAQPLTELSAD